MSSHDAIFHCWCNNCALKSRIIRRFFVSLCLISLFLVASVSISLAAGELRPFLNDAGLFDPARGPVTISYQLYNDANTIEVRVKDFRGQIVDRFDFVDLRAGDHSFDWDGNDDNDERLPDGRYQLLIGVKLTDGGQDLAAVDVRIATIDEQEGAQIPEPLAPEEYGHQVSGSLSSFLRYDNEESSDDGEVRFRTRFDYKKENQTVKGTLSVLQGFHDQDMVFNGTQALAEQRWSSGKAKAVFRDNLGSFNDPMQLFSDFKTERNKIGLRAEQNIGMFQAIGLIYDSEGDVDNREQGLASRLTYGQERKWQIGANYTMRRATDITSRYSEERVTDHATSIDFRLPLFDSLEILLEVASTKDAKNKTDQGYLLRGEYDLGQIRLSGGYIGLGKYFNASYSDPLPHVDRDGSGLEASVDYFMAQPIWKLNNLSASVRFFNLTRHSDNEPVQELDGSLRFGIGENNNFFFSVFNREDGQVHSQSLMGSLTHKWNEEWSSRLQSNYSGTDTSSTVRITVDTSLKQDDESTRLSFDWMKREIDYSRQSPYEENHIRFDMNRELWRLQLQGKYSQNSDDSGTNFYGRLEYKPMFLHRYQLIAYTAIGDQSAFSFTELFEVGLEVSF